MFSVQKIPYNEMVFGIFHLTFLMQAFAQIQSLIYYFHMNIFIAGLTYQITEPDLKELFEVYGTVTSAKIITDKFSGRSRGFGFVEMDDEAEARRAIEELNEAEYDGRTLTVDVAKPRREHQDRS